MKKKYDCKVYTYDQDGRCFLFQDLIEDVTDYIKKLDIFNSSWAEIEIFLPSSTLAILMGNDDSQFIGRIFNSNSRHVFMVE